MYIFVYNDPISSPFSKTHERTKLQENNPEAMFNGQTIMLIIFYESLVFNILSSEVLQKVFLLHSTLLKLLSPFQPQFNVDSL